MTARLPRKQTAKSNGTNYHHFKINYMSKALKTFMIYANAALGKDDGRMTGHRDITGPGYAYPKPATYKRAEPKPFSKKARKRVKAAGRKALLGHIPNKHERKLLYRYAAHIRNYIAKKQEQA
jgi:hypothetical protein